MDNIPLSFITFPLWWYGEGVKVAWAFFLKQYKFGLQSTGLLIFARHMAEPIYGDYTRAGMIVGFFLRSVILIFKILVFGLRLGIISALLGLYLLLPPFTVVMIIYQLFPF